MKSSWILKTNNFKHSALDADVVFCEKQKIAILSVKKLSLYWALALVSLFVPVLHFILVPTFLVIGLIVFFSIYKNTHYLTTGSYVCPLCDNKVPIEKIYFYENKKINCDICMEHLVFEQTKT